MVTGGYNEVAVNDIMSRISGGLEEYAKLNASWKANKSRLLSGKRPAEKPDPMRVWVDDAVALEAIEELASDSKEQIKSAWLKSAKTFMEKCTATNFAPPYSQDELDAVRWHAGEKMREANNEFHVRVRVLFCFDAEPCFHETREPKTAVQLEALAQQYADGVWMCFIYNIHYFVRLCDFLRL